MNESAQDINYPLRLRTVGSLRASLATSATNAGALLHRLQGFRNERGDVVGFFAAIGEGLIQGEVRQRQAGERREMVVARIDANNAVEDVNAMPSQAPAQRQKRRRRVTEHARPAAIVLVKLHIA